MRNAPLLLGIAVLGLAASAKADQPALPFVGQRQFNFYGGTGTVGIWSTRVARDQASAPAGTEADAGRHIQDGAGCERPAA